MPNWCSADLKVMGDKKDLLRFKDFAKGDQKEYAIDTNAFIPYPEEFKRNDEAHAKDDTVQDSYNHGGYEWCCNNWGTKWGICHAEIVEETDKNMIYTFDTAWSPAIPVIRKMAEMFPELRFYYFYYEGGVGFSGKFFIRGNIIRKDETNNSYRGSRGG